MKTRLLLVLILAAAIPATAQVIQPGFTPGHLLRCTYYAGPSGSASNSGKTSSSPIRISDFWALASAGDTLCLNSGTYQGSAQMITPPSGLSGSSGSPITIRAINEGSVLIDGQHQRGPVSLPSSSSWFVLEGFNAARASSTVIAVRGSNNILRRIIAWDARMDVNSDTWVITEDSAFNNLLEDVAGFGVGKNIFSFARLGPGNVCRRCYARWGGSTNAEFKRVINLLYTPSSGATCENCIAIWAAESMPQTYNVADAGAVWGDQMTNFQVYLNGPLYWAASNDPLTASQVKIYGSLGISLANAPGGTGPTVYGGVFQKNNSGVQLKHTLMYTPANHPNFSQISGYLFENAASPTNTADHITAVRGAADQFNGLQTVTNSTFGTTLTINPWTNTGNGANLCRRWINGAVTNQPLWPWPMNERIKDATRTAGAYTGPCVSCVGGRATRTEVDVTAEVEAHLGPIPAACKS